MPIKTPRTDYNPEIPFKPSDDPISLFSQWYKTALQSAVPELNAMSLATVDSNNQPSVRMVLLKEFDQDGFKFYTNLESEKSEEIKHNPKVALCLYWETLHRQIRIRGKATLLARDKVDTYFSSRPIGAQISATVSKQSRELKSYAELEKACEELKAKLGDKKLPTPEHWGGYIVEASDIEFWQGAKNRLHDRVLYTKTSKGLWQSTRLNP